MSTTVTNTKRRARALSAGKNHGTQMQSWLATFEKGPTAVRREMQKLVKQFRAPARLTDANVEALNRLIDALTIGAVDHTPLDVSRQVRQIYQELKGEKGTHPLVLAAASIADDSVQHASGSARVVIGPNMPSFSSLADQLSYLVSVNAILEVTPNLPTDSVIKIATNTASAASALVAHGGSVII